MKINLLKTDFVVSFVLLFSFSVEMIYGQQRDVDPYITKFLDPKNNPGMMIAAHRGFWYNAPENSIKAIEEAIRLKADMVELDVNNTLDGVLILMHDSSLERTTSIRDHPNYEEFKKRFKPGTTVAAGMALVNNVTWEELNMTNPLTKEPYVKLLDRHGKVYYTFDKEGKKLYQKIPLVTDVFEVTKDKILLNLDKADKYLVKIWDLIKQYGVQDQTITKGYLSLWELNQKYESNFLSEIMSQHIYTPIANDKVPYDHQPHEDSSYRRETLDLIKNSIEEFMNDFLVAKDINGHPWADAFEPNPESLNSPIKSLIQEVAIPENKRVGTFSAYADLGEGHAINQGRWKFDPPFELRQNWDLCTKVGIDYIITDRIKFLQEYKTSIERIREKPSGFLDLEEISASSIGEGATLVATHRAGNGSLGVENTLYAINQCINNGIDIIEIDIFRSSDGVYHVFHDRSLVKVTNVKDLFDNRQIKYIDPDAFTLDYASSKYSSEEISQLKLFARKGPIIKGVTAHKIPTLVEVLKLCKGKIIIRLDKWDDTGDRNNKVAEILELIEAEDMFDQVIFGGVQSASSFNQIFGEKKNKIYFSPVVNSGTKKEKIDAYLTGEYKIPFFRIRLGNEKNAQNAYLKLKPLIEYIRDTKGKWIYNSLVLTGNKSQSGTAKDEEEGWLDIIEKGINIIETDYPLRLRKWLKNNQYCLSDYGQINCP